MFRAKINEGLKGALDYLRPLPFVLTAAAGFLLAGSVTKSRADDLELETLKFLHRV